MSKKLGFIGAGNMASAIIGGIIGSGVFNASQIYTSDINKDLLKNIAEKYGVQTTFSNIEVVKSSDVIFLCVKPNIYGMVINEIKNHVDNQKIMVSIAAGKSICQMNKAFNKEVKIIRTMPNTPALVGLGMTAICPAKNIPTEDAKLILSIFKSIGKAEMLPENLFDAFIGVAGSSPAYVYMLIETMADAGVKFGLTRDIALNFSAQTVLGAAQMVLETGVHPAALKDAVCSPGGTTIAAVTELEAQGFRNAIIQAITACVEKSIKMGEQIP